MTAEALRVGLIGAGGISRVHAQAWLALGAEAYVTSPHSAGALASEYGFRTIADLDELIDLVDVVDILTPSRLHAEQALAAIARGRHVICEKPLAATASAAQEVVRAAEDAGVRLFPAHVVRYFPAYWGIRRAVAAGRLGTVSEIRLSRAGTAPTAPWFFRESDGGGLIRDLMIHDIDQALWLAGPVTTVSARQDPPAADDVLPVPVTADVELTHRNGIVSRLHAGWHAPGTPFRTTIDVIGTAGRMQHDSAADTAGYLPPETTQESPYLTQLRDFVAALKTGGNARITAAEGIEPIRVAEAAYASIAAGAPIEMSSI